jgi:hypothetical protein
MISQVFNRPLKRVGPWKPRTLYMHDGSPFDMDAGERITRYTGTRDIWPYPPIIGYALPFMPQLTGVLYQQAVALPIGNINVDIGNQANLQNQIVIPGLQKQG